MENELDNLPRRITQLQYLRKLPLYNNKFSALPYEITAMTSLHVIDLCDNQLTRLFKKPAKIASSPGRYLFFYCFFCSPISVTVCYFCSLSLSLSLSSLSSLLSCSLWLSFVLSFSFLFLSRVLSHLFLSHVLSSLSLYQFLLTHSFIISYKPNDKASSPSSKEQWESLEQKSHPAQKPFKQHTPRHQAQDEQWV